MADIELVIKIDEDIYKARQHWVANSKRMVDELDIAIANGTPLPKGHGKLVDISKIDEDRIESDNPVIYLTINGEYIEVVSLDYLNSLSTIIEADKESER